MLSFHSKATSYLSPLNQTFSLNVSVESSYLSQLLIPTDSVSQNCFNVLTTGSLWMSNKTVEPPEITKFMVTIDVHHFRCLLAQIKAIQIWMARGFSCKQLASLFSEFLLSKGVKIADKIKMLRLRC